MKALFVAHNTRLSGANKSFISLIKQLNIKMEIVVLVNATNGELIARLDAMGIKYFFCKYDWWDAHPRNNIIKQVFRYCTDAKNYYVRKLSNEQIKFLEFEKFDFVYTNTSTVDIGAKISERLNIPHYWHIREFGMEDFSFIPLTSKKYRKKLFNQAEKIIVISEALRNKYEDIVSSDKIEVVYNGFEIEVLRCNERKHDFRKEINILATGMVCNAKGQDQAVRAVARLQEKGFPVQLYLAGEIDHSFLDPVLGEFSDSEHWVTLLGTVKDMYSFRKKIDIELVCSKSEAFGRVTLEAMLHSIPVVGSNRGGTPELIEHRKTGMLFEYGKIDSLEKSITELISDQCLYSDIVNAAIAYALEFTIERTAAKVWQIFTNEEK